MPIPKSANRFLGAEYMFTKKIATFIGLLAAPVVHAQENVQVNASLQCSFSAECFEQEACSETNYSFDMPYYWTKRKTGDLGGTGWGTVTDDAGDRKMVILFDAGQLTAAKIDMTSETLIPSERFDLVMAADGAARLIVVQTAEPMMITYHGTCEGNE